jgi:hypothetical protein
MHSGAGKMPWSRLGRWAAAIALFILATAGIHGARGYWIRERALGEIEPRVSRSMLDARTFALLDRVFSIQPLDGMANYLWGSAVVRLEMQKARQGEAQRVDLAAIEAGVRRLETAVQTILFPSRPMLALGQGLLFTARTQRTTVAPEHTQAQAAQAGELIRRALVLEPRPRGNAIELWIETARAGDLARRPDLVAMALASRALYPDLSTTAAVETEALGIEQNMALALGNGPAAANAVLRRWLRDPENQDLWNQMAALSLLPHTREASLEFLAILMARFPEKSLPEEYYRKVLERKSYVK